MVIDTGLPLSTFHDLLQLAADFVDFWKFGFGSANVYPSEIIASKVTLCQEYGVLAYPGGTSMEIAISQGVWKEYLESLKRGGIRVVEVSDGTIQMDRNLRNTIIHTAKQMGFQVLSEVGKKRVDERLDVATQVAAIQEDLKAGADYVIIEGRETGEEVGVYEKDGQVREQDVDTLVNSLGHLATRLIWEAPQKSQQIYYVSKYGNRVNLGNIAPLDLVPLESIRRGLRSDTLQVALDGGPESELGQSTSKSTSGTTGKTSTSQTGPSRPKLWKPGQSRPADGTQRKQRPEDGRRPSDG